MVVRRGKCSKDHETLRGGTLGKGTRYKPVVNKFEGNGHQNQCLELAISPYRPRSRVVSYACNTLACDSSV